MIDVHCHLNFKSFANDYDKVIKNAFEAGVTTIINVGTQIESSKRAVELAKQYKNLYAIVGVHPHHADTVQKCHPERSEGSHEISKQVMHDSGWLDELEKLAKDPKVIAIGEIGMDYYRYQSNGIVDSKLQKEVFTRQIELAYKLKLPLQIHNRHAGNDILNVLIDHKSYILNPPGMFHCFSGTIDLLKKVLELGFYIGFDGNITYEGLAPGEDTQLSELATYAPLDRIVIETDSPYLTPKPHRGSRNEPKYAILIGEFIAKIKGISFEQVDEQTTTNVERIFKLSSKL